MKKYSVSSPSFYILTARAHRKISENNTILVIPSVSRGILYRTKKLFRTRLYTWLPPPGEAGAKRLMRGYKPYFDQNGYSKDGTTLIRHAPQKRLVPPSPLKRVKA